jgi:flagellar FliJ protein
MKKFHFSLDGALRLRQAQLNSAEMKLREIVAQEQRIRRSLEAIAFERRDASTYVQQHSTDSQALRALPTYFIGLEMRRTNLSRSLEMVSESIRMQRQVLTDIERALKLLNKLRERRLAEWRKQVNRETEVTAQECWLATHREIRNP